MSLENPAPHSPDEEQTGEAIEAAPTSTTIATTGKRQAFRDIRRQITEADLANPGVMRLVLENLERADAECEILSGFVDRYYAADKQAAVLNEKLRTQTALEVLFGIGVGLGGAIVGITPLFWDGTSKGPITLAVGLLLVGGSTVARIVKR